MDGLISLTQFPAVFRSAGEKKGKSLARLHRRQWGRGLRPGWKKRAPDWNASLPLSSDRSDRPIGARGQRTPATVTTQIVRDITETLGGPEGWIGMASPESEGINLPVSKQKAFDKAPGSSPSDVCRNGEACAALPQEKPYIAELWGITLEGELP